MHDSFEKGDRVFNVSRWADDGKLHLGYADITDVVVTYTPKGRPRKPIYKARAVNFTANGATDIEIEPSWYSTSAVKAVTREMRKYFEMKRNDAASPEQRLLRAAFGEQPDCQIRPDDIVDMIYDLKNFHELYAEAFTLDNEKVQDI